MKVIHYNILQKVFLLLLLTIISVSMVAQKRTVMNRPYIDQRRFHYGFLAGVHMQDMELQQNGYKDARFRISNPVSP